MTQTTPENTHADQIDVPQYFSNQDITDITKEATEANAISSGLAGLFVTFGWCATMMFFNLARPLYDTLVGWEVGALICLVIGGLLGFGLYMLTRKLCFRAATLSHSLEEHPKVYAVGYREGYEAAMRDMAAKAPQDATS